MTTNALILFILYLYTYLCCLLFLMFIVIIIGICCNNLNDIYHVFIGIVFIHILFIFIELDLNSPLFSTCIIIFI